MTDEHESPEPITAKRVHRWLGFIADISLIPLFAIAVLDTHAELTTGEHQLFDLSNLGFCILYSAEWLLGLVLAERRIAYLLSPIKLADLISAIPFGHIFQGLRVLRLLRAARLLRLVWRVKRYRSLGTRIVRAAFVSMSTILAGGLAIEIAEPETFPSLTDALWWSMVTVSTVGYGDVVPQTVVGRAVATGLIIFGIGIFGYVAGFMATVLDDPDEEEILAISRRTEAEVAELRNEIRELRAVLQEMRPARALPDRDPLDPGAPTESSSE